MNVTRIAILGVAATAAGAAAILVRMMLGGQTAPVEASAPPPVMTTEVLVASTTIPPGRKLEAGAVRWDAWPTTAVAGNFFTKQAQPEIAKAVDGIIVRSPLVAGQPITSANTVRADTVGFMAATLMPGMRAVAMPVTTDSGAGGFLLPNDRVDVILVHDVTQQGNGGNALVAVNTGVKIWRSDTILQDVRLLAIDQMAEPAGDKDAGQTESQVGKVATLEITPSQAELLHRARASGSLYLTLRSLGDSDGRSSTKVPTLGPSISIGGTTVVRYGVVRDARPRF
jgi:pilus assembly protein CpaB